MIDNECIKLLIFCMPLIVIFVVFYTIISIIYSAESRWHMQISRNEGNRD